MPVISVSIIYNPRSRRKCGVCGRVIEGRTVRLYGMAEVGDNPYAAYCHRDCIIQSKEVRARIIQLEKECEA